MFKKYFFIFILFSSTLITFSGSLNIVEIIEGIQKYEKIISINPDDAISTLELAKLYEILGKNGDRESLETAKILFEKAFRIDEDLNEAHLRYGSVLAKISEYTWFSPIKLWYVNTAFKEMEMAVNLEFDNIEFRLIRAESCYNLLEFEFCENAIITDYKYLLENFESEIYDQKLKIYSRLAKIFELKKDFYSAIEIYNKIIKEFPNTIESQRAEKSIDLLLGIQKVK
ncbi:hypothetical protein OF820_07205 [Oceanotoga sp. DSM 15011]|jgi:tetratricopeptide (TPR) repeat protein|uniref:Tetratricopeptide repeat protein n=1 Tax=Oceanotoga teriensis TaxID=515440 RepID=A0AA45HHY5_9BACT|nr:MULTISPECIES: hypothetical protein [Oceanotoga]MDN5341703.1 hypothetical protein [Oceanotoga sp.]MDO7976347.1 hypothetical protein [Oceanotoga teriensis]PWJ89282.1 hypothetical protein C7380_1158 [Oceanotoga teriensis]UYO98861.1 hypothetical protein OF820_07205 [Oceanotoga sp. DSM 15011]